MKPKHKITAYLMRVRSRLAFIALLTGPVICLSLSAQVTQKTINPYHEAYYDSLKAMDYPYTFPLLAKKGYKRGYDIPYTFGVSGAFYNQRQGVNITSTNIGIGDLGPVDLSGFIRFGDIENRSTVFTVRPDMWVLPFLSIYGIFGVGTSETTVPLVRPVNFTTVQKFDATSAGVGVTLAGGIGPVFLVVDNNINFANLESFVEPVPAYNLDIRVGHNFINARRADRSLAIWFGTFYQQIKGETKGSIRVSDLFPNGSDDLGEHFIDHLYEWADDLPPAQKIVANQIIGKIEDFFNGIEGAGDTEITYNLQKELAGPWNLVFGAQYQHNKHLQIRTEVGTFGKRSSFLLMVNYRFEHFGKKRT